MAVVGRLFPGAELVLGAETVAQVRELAKARRQFVDPDLIQAALDLGRAAPPDLFDPRKWKLTG
jgi:hypothetical protein